MNSFEIARVGELVQIHDVAVPILVQRESDEIGPYKAGAAGDQ